jgi:hypothetical protein
MRSDRFNGIEKLHGEKVGYCYPSGLEKTLCKWDTYVLLVTKGLTHNKAIPHLAMLANTYVRFKCVFFCTSLVKNNAL